MRELVKKLSVIFVTLIFLVLGSTVASVASVQEGPSDESEFTRTVTLYRYGPDGSVTPISVNYDPADGQDIDEVIVEKCSRLLENDPVIKNYIFDGNISINLSGISRVRSKGVGFHWKSPFGIRIPFTIVLRYGMFQIVPLRYKIFGMNVIPRVYCEYLEDENAFTEITPLSTPLRHNGDTIPIEGNHTVAVYGFIGYTGWRGMNAQYIDDHGIRAGFDGYAFFVACAKFP